jgi:hypothetical protein
MNGKGVLKSISLKYGTSRGNAISHIALYEAISQGRKHPGYLQSPGRFPALPEEAHVDNPVHIIVNLNFNSP